MDAFFDKINLEMLQDKKSKLCGNSLFTLLKKADTEQNCNYYIRKNVKGDFTPKSEESKYFYQDIQNHIRLSAKKCHQMVVQFPNRKITINFISIDNNTINVYEYIEYLLLWFKLMNMISNNNINKRLFISIYATPFKKELPSPTEMLTSKHINSGYTYPCMDNGNIVIYRKEEWFKVLLHESIHSFCLDFSQMNQDIMASQVTGAYVSTPLYSETYAELWAEMLQCAMLSFFQSEKKQYNFSLYFYFYCHLEYIHSVSIVSNILSYYGISFNELREKILIHQDTHVYEYYILKTILFSDYNAFIAWCLNHNNKTIISFTKTYENCLDFCELINQCYKRCDYNEMISAQDKNLTHNSLAMSLIEIV
tara:strand:- start:2722 stop:3819 length:1098 start_codon:yes stop_codon:yes gene_type:complete